MNHEMIWILQALAQPYEIQVSLFPDFACAADELALEWERVFLGIKNAGDAISRELDEIDSKILSISGINNAEFWTDAALQERKEWEDIRDLARTALTKIGIDISAPGKHSAICNNHQ